ncbi:NAD(P)H-binding protein [Amycolatopsis sp. cg9]|uniref:NAD(P)H-binding protein n=1 Tax=Amycolatopsis sp. cg9 TaxID=3238801 RepID=UPI0035251AED
MTTAVPSRPQAGSCLILFALSPRDAAPGRVVTPGECGTSLRGSVTETAPAASRGHPSDQAEGHRGGKDDRHPHRDLRRKRADRPPAHPAGTRRRVLGADVLDPAAVDAAVAHQDAVLSALGVPAAKTPITTCSRGTGAIVAAMRRHDVRRLVVVSSSGVAPRPYSDGGFLFNRVLLPYVTRVLGKTLYDDMRRMEALVRAGDLDWTIVRPGGLYHLPAATGYTLAESDADGRFTARADLAASMLDLVAGNRYLGATVGVITTTDNPTLLQWFRQNARAKG